MSLRIVWTVLPAIALSASVAGVGVRHAGNAATADGTMIVLLPPDSDPLNLAVARPETARPDPFTSDPFTPNPLTAAVHSDLGLAASGLADGPLTTLAAAGAARRRPAAGRTAAVAPPPPRSRLPEPATWVMLIGGMYGIGAALRRRQRLSEAAFTARIRAIAANEHRPDEE